MSNSHPDDDEFLLSLSDLKHIFHRSKKTIYYGVFIFAVLAGMLSLVRPIRYTSESSFRERTKADGPGKDMLSIIVSGSNKDNPAITIFKSRRIMEGAIKKHDLQGEVRPYDWKPRIMSYVLERLSFIPDNIITQWAYINNWQTPSVKDEQLEFVAKNIDYDGEIPLYYHFYLNPDQTFSVYTKKDGEIGKGKIGQPFNHNDVAFTLTKVSTGPLKTDHYVLALEPIFKVAKNLANHLEITTELTDKNYLELILVYPNRILSGQVLDSIMESYRNYLMQEQHKVAEHQIAYLKQREDEMDDQLTSLMKKHVENIAEQAGTLELLITAQQSFKKRQLSIDLEIKNMQKALEEGSCFYERYSAETDPPIIQTTLAEIRNCRHQCDTIDLALRDKNSYDANAQKQAFEKHMQELKSVRTCAKEAKMILECLDKKEIPLQTTLLFDSPKYMVKGWTERLANTALSDDERSKCRNHFYTYVANLLHLFEVHEKTIHDRLVHQQNPQTEFQGIDLATANGLYITYSKEMHQIEADLSQNKFLIEQIQKPEFEISSLTAVLNDPVSREIIGKSSTISLQSKDQSNRTTREQERSKQDLDLQKNFLTIHLQQVIHLLELRAQLLAEKIKAIQNVTLELVQQKKSILEKHLKDYTLSRINNLTHEQKVIAQQQHELKLEMERIPQQWAAQKIVDLHLQKNQALLQQIGTMIETKNIADNIDVTLSSPLDKALVPIHPNSPRFLLLAILGAFAGGFLTFCGLLIKAAATGVFATPDNLQLIGQHVSGQLSQRDANISKQALSDVDLGTLRKLSAYLCPTDMDRLGRAGETLLLLEGKGSDYATELAELLAMRGMKVLLLPISFDLAVPSGELPGLLQYLQGQEENPKVINQNSFDVVSGGGISRFANEMVESERFKHLLQEYEKQYDWVIAVSKVTASSPEGEALLTLFKHAAVTVKDDKLHDLKPYIKSAKAGRKKISFLF